MFLPCGMQETLLKVDGLEEDRISQDCNNDYDQLTEYLSTVNIYIYSNNGQESVYIVDDESFFTSFVKNSFIALSL